MADALKLPPGYSIDPTPQVPRLPAGYTLDPQDASPKSVGGFLTNVGTSGGNFIGDLGHAVAHPIDTAGGVVKTAVGTVDKLAGGTGTAESNALWDHLKRRYGSFDKVKETMYTDPVGFLGDLSILADGAGVVAETSKLGKVAEIAKTVSKATDPIRGTAAAVGAIPGVSEGVTAAADATKTALNRGALRTGYTVNTDAAKVTGAAEAMTEHSIPFSEEGQAKVQGLLSDLQKRKEGEVSGPVRVGPAAVESRLDEAASKNEWQVNPNADQKQMEAVRHAFRERTGGQPMLDASGKPMKDRFGNKMFSQGTGIPADEAQALKEGTYAHNDYESTPAHRKATADAEMALARGLKEELETQLPELKGLNDSQRKLLNLDDILGTAVNKYTNDGGFWGSLAKNTISSPKGALKTAGVLASGTAVHQPLAGAAVTLMQAILADPSVKARLATAVDLAQRNTKKFGQAGATATGVSRVQSYLDSLSPQEQK